jgi:DNA-binding transcriptional ArsR family regulator
MNIKPAKSPVAPDAGDMLAKAGVAAEFLRSLAHEHRLAILCALEAGPMKVGALAAALGLAQPKVSQHLGKLRDQGLVAATRRGTSIEYRAVSGTARSIVAALQAEFCPPDSPAVSPAVSPAASSTVSLVAAPKPRRP